MTDSRLKVLMTADAVGGVWNYSLELARALAAHNVEFLIATMGRLPTDAQRQEAAAIPNVRLCESEYKLEWMVDPWDEVDAAGEWLLHLERHFQPNLVHLNGYVHAAISWSVPKVIAAHSCVLSWWRAVKGGPAPDDEWGIYAQRVSQGLRAADFVVAPSRAMLASIQELYPPFTGAVAAIPNGRAPSAFYCGRKHPFIFCAGRLWDEGKNLRAVQRVASHVSWPVYSAGESLLPGDDSGLARQDENYRCLGPLDSTQIALWLSTAAIYCSLPRYEPFGLAILEAALSGCALVLGDIPSLREIWDGAAVFVPLDDEDRLVRALRSLIVNPSLRKELAEKARLRSLHFTPEKMARAYLGVYRSILAPRSSTSSMLEVPSCVS
ncbi:MAG TPA: glycosyltransferase family 4 protein [Candidatus Acidoferrales bacterium]|nr:glycosyltransferase family 4 protein [Candidatus Acidoferrales bacterium]